MGMLHGNVTWPRKATLDRKTDREVSGCCTNLRRRPCFTRQKNHKGQHIVHFSFLCACHIDHCTSVDLLENPLPSRTGRDRLPPPTREKSESTRGWSVMSGLFHSLAFERLAWRGRRKCPGRLVLPSSHTPSNRYRRVQRPIQRANRGFPRAIAEEAVLFTFPPK